MKKILKGKGSDKMNYQEALCVVEKWNTSSGLRSFCEEKCKGKCCSPCKEKSCIYGRKLSCSMYICPTICEKIFSYETRSIYRNLKINIERKLRVRNPYFYQISSKKINDFSIDESELVSFFNDETAAILRKRICY